MPGDTLLQRDPLRPERDEQAPELRRFLVERVPALDAERTRGLATRDAIFEACSLRFRPIMMTTMAATFGGLPLAIGMGVGSELRHPLGVAMVGGLLLSQALTLFTTPVIYLYMDRLGRWLRPRRGGVPMSGRPVPAEGLGS